MIFRHISISNYCKNSYFTISQKYRNIQTNNIQNYYYNLVINTSYSSKYTKSYSSKYIISYIGNCLER